MKRDIKINYGKIEDIISNIIKYDGALNDMEASLNCIKGQINNSTGESIDSLLNNYELLIKNIGICKEELNDLRKILSDYINEMSGYAQAIHRGSLIRVDRNDVWWNIKSMEGIINQITDEQMRWGYNYSGSWSSDKDVIRREEYNASQIESINHIVEKYVNILNQKIQEIYAIHNSKVIPFENTDDAFRDRAWNMYWKCTGLGDWVGDFFGFLDKSFNNIIDGVLKGLTDLVVGLAQLAIGAVEYVGSCAVVVLCEPFGGAPDWIKNKMNSGNELISSILKDPALIIEGIAQDASDAIDEKGICYSVGYLGGTFLGTKGLDKITKGVKGLISGGKGATINSLDDIGRYGLNSLDDIIEKAGIQSVDDLTRIGVTSAEDLSKLGVNSVDDLAKLGIDNIDELSKLGISADDLSRSGIKTNFENEIPLTGEEWNEFLSEKYGPKNVTWETKGAGNLKFKEGYYVEHTTGPVQKFTERNGISGGHNYDEFKNYFNDESNKYQLVEISRKQHPDIDGIFDIEYKAKYEKMDYTGTKGSGEYKTIPNGDKVYKKTVYNQKIISNDEIIDLSKKAMEEGIKNERVIKLVKQNKMKIRGQANYNGKILKFEGMKNLETGEIENAYPVLEWEK
ncbi:CdiA family toxin C-terminal domain-containing protein [Clostridium sporogenes]|uniref:CdiA family toxin C-terminal domain-containing protein n=1 Tax=Clostridium sporogenes TaxID=1509 RepID=UPI003F934618